MPQLELLLVGELVHLALELHELRLLVVQEGPCHQDLVCRRERALLVALGHVPVFPLHVEDKESAILRCGEEVVVIEGDADPGGRRSVRRELVVVAVQRELVAPNGPRRVRLRHRGEQTLRGVRQDDLPQRGVGLHHVLRLPLADLSQHLVAAHNVHSVSAGGEVRVHDHTAEGGPLLYKVVAHTSTVAPRDRLRLHVVLVDRPIRPRGDQHGVVRRPGHRAHLVVVAPQRLNWLAGVGLVHLDGVGGVGVHRCKVLPPVTKAALPALLDRDVFVGLHVLHEQVHEPQPVRLPDDEVETRRVERDTVGLLVEPLAQGAGLLHVVPHPRGLVDAAGDHQGLPDAHVHAQDGPCVEVAQHRLKGCRLLRLQQVLAQKGELVQLSGAGGYCQELLGGAQRQRPDRGAAGLHLQRPRVAVHLLGLVALLVDANVSVVSADDKALGEGDDGGGGPRLPGAGGQQRLEIACVVEEQEVAVLAGHQHLVVVQPGVAHEALQLRGRHWQRLEPFLELHELEDAVPDDANHGAVRGVKGALPDQRVLRVGHLDGSHVPRFVPDPVDQGPVVLLAGGLPRLRQQVLGIRREGHAHELRRVRLGPTQRLPLLGGHEVEDGADGALVALLRHRQISLGVVHRHAGETLRALISLKDLLLLLVRLPEDCIGPRWVQNLRLLRIVHVVLHLGPQAEDVPMRQRDGWAIAGAFLHGSRAPRPARAGAKDPS
mmetsp:Transcript_38706/g.92446  ORF Transcript_38706/g.92446 Transcript_38706/m.92446 type:complete len:716 (+) Transcript_38706:1577-3724(+)